MSATEQKHGLLPKAILASIGAVAGVLGWTRACLAKAIERGEMAEMEAQEAAVGQQPEPPVQVMPAASMRWPWVATRSDLRVLQQRIDQLSEEIAVLEGQQAEPTAGAAAEAS
jgi:hypothetical protein